jgi:predicted molibdopterin-dependent oxidoreductase YjgC
MPDDVRLRIDGEVIVVPAGATVAAALLARDGGAARRSVDGALRGPLCGMGVCQECRVTIDGERHQRACLRVAVEGLEILTGIG